MSNNSNKKLSTSSKSTSSKSQNTNTGDQSMISDSILANLINDVVERANRLSSNMLSYSISQSAKDNGHYEVSIKDHIQRSNQIKPVHFECTCMGFKFHGMACKHIFAIYQKYYFMQIPHTTSDQTLRESETVHSVAFSSWIEAIQKVWDRHSQEDRNRMTDADLEAIVEAGMKRKSSASLYNDFTIPISN
ncbi:8514_t:CDS:2, partial [Gigaspora margarita]